MQNGSEMIKVRPNGKQYHRLFTLDMDLKEIKWVPSSKKKEKAKSKESNNCDYKAVLASVLCLVFTWKL